MSKSLMVGIIVGSILTMTITTICDVKLLEILKMRGEKVTQDNASLNDSADGHCMELKENPDEEMIVGQSVGSHDHDHCNQKIKAERIGRINAEKRLRQKVIDKISTPSIGFPLLVIGHVLSPYLQRRGTPRQGLLVPSSISIIELSKDIPKESLEGLDGYSHLFIHFLFHENTNLVKTILSAYDESNLSDSYDESLDKTDTVDDILDSTNHKIDIMGHKKDIICDKKDIISDKKDIIGHKKETAKKRKYHKTKKNGLKQRTEQTKSSSFTSRVHSFAARVCPPLLHGQTLGLFATRSPHRPNPLGQSLVKILKVDIENRRVIVGGADLVNGTPIFDLKPWGPFDCPSCCHQIVQHNQSPACQVDVIANDVNNKCLSSHTKIPDWVRYGLQDPYILQVQWQPQAIECLKQIVNQGKTLFYHNNCQGLQQAITELLSLDIRSVHRGRINQPNIINNLASDLIGDRLKQELEVSGQEYEVEFDQCHVDFMIQLVNGQPCVDIYRVIPIK